MNKMRLIDSEKLIEYCNNQKVKTIDANDIARFPTIDAAPVKHGKWVENKYGYITCSNCDSFPLEAMTGSLATIHYEPYESEYCPHCGAKMDLEEI